VIHKGGRLNHQIRYAVSIGSCSERKKAPLASGIQPLDHLKQMRQKPRQKFNPHDNNRISILDPLQYAHQYLSGAVTICLRPKASCR
jgi:hypothetical protein